MNKPEKIIKFLLHLNGWMSVFAVLWVVMPHSWLLWCVDLVEPGLQVTLVVTYLARMVSAFYFLLGVTLLVFANDIRKYRFMIQITMYWCLFIGSFFFVHALGKFEYLATQPFFWFIAGDIVYGMVLTITILLLLRRLDQQTADR